MGLNLQAGATVFSVGPAEFTSPKPAGGAALAFIRTWVSVNLVLGVLIIVSTMIMG